MTNRRCARRHSAIGAGGNSGSPERIDNHCLRTMALLKIRCFAAESDRFSDNLLAAATGERLAEMGWAYVQFSFANPGMFLLTCRWLQVRSAARRDRRRISWAPHGTRRPLGQQRGALGPVCPPVRKFSRRLRVVPISRAMMVGPGTVGLRSFADLRRVRHAHPLMIALSISVETRSLNRARAASCRMAECV
jgi:hypothetical protein